eukprot:TRINITY_DN28359_c0_g1_i1.p1 TRINITY_DN28359_c0_g1~~TRINITY_DN28359_c0_g1_i1.p1  ORF type:complete len:320 (-),score=43.37 TRINITY_DN28359_c0_g1_i1:111-1070(-)
MRPQHGDFIHGDFPHGDFQAVQASQGQSDLQGNMYDRRLMPMTIPLPRFVTDSHRAEPLRQQQQVSRDAPVSVPEFFRSASDAPASEPHARDRRQKGRSKGYASAPSGPRGEAYSNRAGKGKGATSTMSAEHEELVLRVRRLQSGSPSERGQWWRWCQVMASGTRDPKRHTVEFIKKFFLAFESGTLPAQLAAESVQRSSSSTSRHGSLHFQSAAPRQRALTAEASDRFRRLVKQIKDGQRQSSEFKRCWWKHCDTFGGGVRDPSRHQQSFIEGFLRYLDEATLEASPGGSSSNLAAVEPRVSQFPLPPGHGWPVTYSL